jgi:peroxiredoxin Q/BCP
MGELQPGDRAPAFDLPTDDGGRLSLASLKGRPVVLYFYPKADTPSCTKEAQDFTALAGDFAAAGATVVGVSRDPARKHAKFRAKYDLGVVLASDEDSAACEAYGVWGEKVLYGRAYMGVERATFLIDADGRIVRTWRKVRTPGHAQEVLEAVRQASS